MPLSLTRRVGDRIRFRVGTKEAWLTVTGFDDREVSLELDQAGITIPLIRRIGLSTGDPFVFRLGHKEVEVHVRERTRNQIRLSFGGDDSVEVHREELLTGRKASA